ncbi:hypothetical protein GCM10009788_22080 [Nocardioides humi]|uniref:Acyl-coenzyme A thioesterase THEM4 n=1 Tax=Nocardioides humi TaxID=449461 RepID=A0ABN2AH04_9ACTN
MASLLDEVCGEVVERRTSGRSRTAYLHVNFRAIAPLNRPLQIEARIRRSVGRKTYVDATIRDGETGLRPMLRAST